MVWHSFKMIILNTYEFDEADGSKNQQFFLKVIREDCFRNIKNMSFVLTNSFMNLS